MRFDCQVSRSIAHRASLFLLLPPLAVFPFLLDSASSIAIFQFYFSISLQLCSPSFFDLYLSYLLLSRPYTFLPLNFSSLLNFCPISFTHRSPPPPSRLHVPFFLSLVDFLARCPLKKTFYNFNSHRCQVIFEFRFHTWLLCRVTLGTNNKNHISLTEKNKW